MTIERVYLGTWFPRTSIHLNEVYRFLVSGENGGVDQRKLESLREKLNVTRVVLQNAPDDLNSILATCGDVTVRIAEDGTILLHREVKDHRKDISILELFYTQKFGPALAYLFSRGAPLPKVPTSIEDVLPRILIVKNAAPDEVRAFFKDTKDTPLGSVATDDLDVSFGTFTDVFNFKNRGAESEFIYDELLETVILFREFRRQLARYLRLHRTTWIEIAKIQEAPRLSYKDFPELHEQILNASRTVAFTRARLAQMGDVLEARSAVTERDLRTKINKLGLGRIETLRSDLSYMRHLWQMTERYVDHVSEFLESLSRENTQRELRILQFVAALGVVMGFFGMNVAFPWKTEWETHAWSFFLVSAVIVVAAYFLYLVLKQLVINRRFDTHQK